MTASFCPPRTRPRRLAHDNHLPRPADRRHESLLPGGGGRGNPGRLPGLVGWLLQVEALKSMIPGRLAMNPGTAFLFIVAGVSLVLQQTERSGASARRAGQVLAVFLFLAALATLPGSVLTWENSWDRLLFHDQLGDNRVAPNTAFNFILIGLSLFLLNLHSRTARRAAQSVALAGAFVSLLAILGYAYGELSLSGIGPYIRMALHTALLGGLLCVGVLSPPQ